MQPAIPDLFITSLTESLLMVGLSGLAGTIVGVPLGLGLFLCMGKAVQLHGLLSVAITGVRSMPSIVLIAVAIPLVQLWLGETAAIGSAIVPLAIIAIAFIGRKIATALAKAERQYIDSGHMQSRSTPGRIVTLLIPRAGADIVAGIGQALSGLVGYSTLAGAISGTGLGGLGLRYGYEPFVPEIMLGVALLLLLMAEAAHVLGHTLAWRLRRLQNIC